MRSNSLRHDHERTHAMVTIDKDVPLPPVTHSKYPWASLNVGDSFLTHFKSTNSAAACKSDAQKRTGFTFIVRLTSEGVRVWRTA
jgi:hypothetical protein